MRRPAAAVAVALAMLVAACGGETRFTASEFVEHANEAGAGLELRERLISTSGAVEVWAVSFTGGGPMSPTPAPDPGGGGTGGAGPGAGAGIAPDFSHGAGSIAVASDPDLGRSEFERCDASATLVCFRAANVVLRLEGATAEETKRLGEVFRSLESG